jgi:hypothetical protein
MMNDIERIRNCGGRYRHFAADPDSYRIGAHSRRLCMKEKARKRGKLSLALVLIIVLSLALSTVVYARVNIQLNRTSMAAMTTQRMYVSGGKGTVRNSNKDVVKLTKDSSSLILTARKAGVTRITATIDGVTKSYKITVYNSNQIADKVQKRVRMAYPSAFYKTMIRRGDYLYLWFVRPKGNDVVKMKVTVNLKSGRAVCENGWKENYSSTPKSFIAF